MNETKKSFSVWDLTLVNSAPSQEKPEVKYTLEFKTDVIMTNAEIRQVLDEVKNMLIIANEN